MDQVAQIGCPSCPENDLPDSIISREVRAAAAPFRRKLYLRLAKMQRKEDSILQVIREIKPTYLGHTDSIRLLDGWQVHRWYYFRNGNFSHKTQSKP